MILEVIDTAPNRVLDTVIDRDNMRLAMKTTVQFRTDMKLRRELEKMARDDHRSLSDYVRLICERFVEDSRATSSRSPEATVTLQRPSL